MNSLTTVTAKNISCTVCEAGSYLFGYEGEFRLNRCRNCGVIHLDETPQTVKAEKSDLEYWCDPQSFKQFKTIYDYFFEDRFEKIQRGDPRGNSWFDLGAGHGWWIDFLKKEKRIQTFGVEIDEEAGQFAQALGLEVSLGDFLTFSSPQKYHVITVCDVLEHLENPLAAIEKCHQLLQQKGLLYIQVPNVLGLKYPWQRELGLPYHLWQFDPKSLAALIEKAGFELVEYWTGVEGVIGHYQKGTAYFPRKLMWKIASLLRRGNRLQMLVRKKEERG